MPSVIMQDQLCYVLLQQTALKIHLAVATHTCATHQRHCRIRRPVMGDGNYAMLDSALPLSVSSMVWRSACVQLRKNFVICVVKRRGECALQQSVCLRYVDGQKTYNLLIIFTENIIS